MAHRPALAAWAALLALAGCVPVHHRPVPIPAEPLPGPAGAEPSPPEGALHVVREGETLYRIARAHGVAVEAIVAANELPDPDVLEVGQVLLIPGAAPALVEREPLSVPEPPPEQGGAGGYLWPVAGGVLLSPFGQPRRRHHHAGLDIGASLGTEVLASREGVVLHSGDGLRGYGRTVILDHGDGWRTLYAHNRRVLVKPGETVVRGQPIAEVGRTGNASTEHVHFEIRQGDRPVDPLPLLEGVAEGKGR